MGINFCRPNGWWRNVPAPQLKQAFFYRTTRIVNTLKLDILNCDQKSLKHQLLQLFWKKFADFDENLSCSWRIGCDCTTNMPGQSELDKASCVVCYTSIHWLAREKPEAVRKKKAHIPRDWVTVTGWEAPSGSPQKAYYCYYYTTILILTNEMLMGGYFLSQ